MMLGMSNFTNHTPALLSSLKFHFYEVMTSFFFWCLNVVPQHYPRIVAARLPLTTCQHVIFFAIPSSFLPYLLSSPLPHPTHPMVAPEKSISGCCLLNCSSSSNFFCSSLVGFPISFCL
jgi:hypothetical protein